MCLDDGVAGHAPRWETKLASWVKLSSVTKDRSTRVSGFIFKPSNGMPGTPHFSVQSSLNYVCTPSIRLPVCASQTIRMKCAFCRDFTMFDSH